MGSSSSCENSDSEESNDVSECSDKFKVKRTTNNSEDVDSMFNKLNSLRQNGTFTDFSVKVQGATIQCNKNILSAQCAYFETMFQSGMKEANVGELTLNDMNPKVVENIINYLYHQKIDIELEHIMDYLDVAEMFLMQDLKLKINDFMNTRVDEDNCVEWYHLSKTYNLRETLHRTKCVILDNFDQVALNPEFHTLTFDDITAIIPYRSNTEDITKLKACVTWILEDKPNRENQLKHLMDHVNMKKCPVEHLARLQEEFKEILESDKELQYKINVEKDIAAMESTNVMMIQREKNNMKIYKLDLCHNLFTEVHNWAGYFSHIQYYGEYSCVTPQGMFSIGYPQKHPDTAFSVCRSCTILDPWLEKVRKLPMFEDNEIFCVTHVEDDKYVFCGLPNEVLPYVLKSGSGESWQLDTYCILNLYKEKSPVMFSIKKLLYVLTTKKYAAGLKLRCFDTTIKEWIRRKPPPIKRLRGAKIVVAQDKAYIVGGEESLCLRYDHSEDQWEELARPPQGNKHGSAFYANGHIYLCGVLRNKTSEDLDNLEDTEEEYASEHVIEEYDIAANCWKRSALPAPPLKDQWCVPYNQYR